MKTSSAARWFSAFWTRGRLALALLVGGCVLLVGVDAMRSLQERAAVLAANQVNGVNLAGSLAQEAQDELQAGAALLAVFAGRIEADGLGPAALERLRRLGADHSLLPPWISGLHAFDTRGVPVVNPDAGQAPTRAVTDRDYFQYHRTHADRTIRIGLTLRSRATGRWIIPLTRRLDNVDGSFAGVALAAVEVAALKRLYSYLGLGERGIVNLFLANGTLLLRHPFDERAIGRSLATLPPYSDTLRLASGSLDIRSPFDGVQRLMSYHRLFDDRLVVVVAQDRSTVLAAWRQSALWHLAGAAMLAAIIAALGSGLLRLNGRAHRRELAAAALDAEHRLVADQSSEMVMRCGRDGRRLYVSPACRRLLGYAPEELLGLRTVDCVHPDDLPGLAGAWQAAAAGPILLTYRMRRKDGSYMWTEASSQLLAGLVDGHPECLVVARDIGERVAAEQRLRQAEARHRLLSEYASDMIFRLDLDLVRRDASPACMDILGYRPDELIGAKSVNIIHPEDAPGVAASLRRMAAGAVDRHINVGRVRHREGHWIWVEVQLRLVRDAGGWPAGIIGVMRDITARRAAEEREAATLARLQRTHDMLLQAEALAHIGNWRLDPSSQELTWSDEIYRILGWKLTESPTLPSAIAAYHPEDRDTIAALVQRAMSSGTPFSFDLRVVRPDGHVRHVSGHGRPEFAANGALIGLVGTLQDVTERTELELGLRQAQKLEAIGRLAAGVAHDFNNLLQVVMGSLEMIGEAFEPGSPLGRCATMALTAAERGSHLTHHLLSYARRQMLQTARLQPVALLSEMQELLARTLGPRIRVGISLAADLPAITVDPAHLQTALLNLGINAGHAMPDGGTLTLEAWREAGPVPTVVIAVADTGIGMDAATLAQACEPFFTTKGVNGSGLGLSMVQGFARQSGGDVRITSQPQRGTRVELRLPATDAADIPAAPAPAAPPIGPCRVLVVDDVPDVLVTTAALLEGESIEVVCAQSGAQALSILQRARPFDVLVTDYAMPDLDGVALLHRARAIQPGLPALVITGYAGVADVDAMPDNAEILRKPFTRRALLAALAEARAEGRSPAALLMEVPS